MSELELELRDRLAAFLAGTATLDEFDDWFSPHTWNLGDPDPGLRQLVDTVRGLLTEYTTGLWAQEELKSQLQRALETQHHYVKSLNVTHLLDLDIEFAFQSAERTVTRSSFVADKQAVEELA